MNNMMNLFNPQIINALRSGNPQTVAMQLLQQNAGNNPILNNVLTMANAGNGAGIEQIARNICNQKGINPDEMIKNIQGTIK